MWFSIMEAENEGRTVRWNDKRVGTCSLVNRFLTFTHFLFAKKLLLKKLGMNSHTNWYLKNGDMVLKKQSWENIVPSHLELVWLKTCFA